MSFRKTASILTVLLLASCTKTHVSDSVSKAPASNEVTAAQLYANPQAHYGKTVIVSGFFTPTWLIESGDGSCFGGATAKQRAVLRYTAADEKFLRAVNYFVTLKARFTEAHSAAVGGGDVVLHYGPDEVLGELSHIEILDVDRGRKCNEKKG